MAVAVEPIDLLATASASAAVQSAALGPLPPERYSVLLRHVTQPDFAAFGAYDGASLVGYTYGARCAVGQWWYDRIAGPLAAAGHQRWLRDAYAVTELHVLPTHHGKGVGFALINALLGQAVGSVALLSTYDEASAARRFYGRLGFVELMTDFRFSSTPQPFVLMGATLPLTLKMPDQPAESA